MSQYDNNFTGVYGTLVVFVHRAKDLINVRKMDKQNPFVILRIQHMTARSKICFRGGQTPSWSFLAKFEITPDIKPILILEVFHETDSAPKFIGKATVDFTTAIFSDENDGDDRWIELSNGVEFAGKVYVEMSFKIKSASEIKSKGRTVLDDIDQFDQSVSSRQLPLLPHEVEPDNEFDEVSSTGGENNQFGYMHGVPGGLRQPVGKTGAQMSSGRIQFNPKNSANRSELEENAYKSQSSMPTLDTYNTAPPNFSNSYDSKHSKVPDSEPLFAKLKELKGKMFSFKNQPITDSESDMSRSNNSNNPNKVDFQALEKAVGVTSGADDTYIEEPSVIDEVEEELEPRFKMFNMANSRRVTSRVTANMGGRYNQDTQNRNVMMNGGQRVESAYHTSLRQPSHLQSPTRNFTLYSNESSPERQAHKSPSRRPPPPSF
ncbi:hypothetical protein ACO0QE_001107 [Hanseniaspora vineae]